MNDRDSLRAFLVEAHRNGYATTEPDQPDDAPGKRIEYADGEWHYVDQYVGSRAFVGFEVVFRDDEPVWGMNYYGAPTDLTIDHAEVYAFLRKALEQVSKSNPYRGPGSFGDGRFAYRTETDGTIERFSGLEAIEMDGTVVYQGEYGGGVVD